MSKNTMIDLIPELEKLTKCEGSRLLIEDAKNGDFHDFRNKKFTCGKVALAGLMKEWIECYPADKDQAQSIYDDVVGGVYDEQMTDDDKEYLKKELENDVSLSEKDKIFFKHAMGIN